MIPADPLIVPAIAFERVPMWLPRCARVTLSHRARRLLACHFASRALPLQVYMPVSDASLAQAIRSGMLYADGEVALANLIKAYGTVSAVTVACSTASLAYSYRQAYLNAARAATNASSPLVASIDYHTARAARVAYAWWSYVPNNASVSDGTQERSAQRRLQSLYLRQNWPDTWRTDAVRGVAESIYLRQDWESVPILGDALEEAGCTDTNWLSWLRSPELRPHWHRGQWAFDFGIGMV